MKKEKVYNEAVSGDEGFAPGDGYPSCDGEPCANVSDETDEATDTLADGEPAAEADAAKALEEAVAQWQDKYVRLQAEFDNYRKRTLKEKMDLVQTGGRDVLLEMLPVRDDVQRAVDAMQKSDDLEALRAGVTLISQKFTEALRRKGVTEIEVLDKEFDADFSEAVARVRRRRREEGQGHRRRSDGLHAGREGAALRKSSCRRVRPWQKKGITTKCWALRRTLTQTK